MCRSEFGTVLLCSTLASPRALPGGIDGTENLLSFCFYRESNHELLPTVVVVVVVGGGHSNHLDIDHSDTPLPILADLLFFVVRHSGGIGILFFRVQYYTLEYILKK